ncbi:4-nitrophenyl phosphatase [Devosia subaequoris]|uniref:4-nitrophenyl phosphatase n=1 Tax=Devosia subaequoris TaxID=395930 RepID=A0A7W6ILC8_9HYPH|nr:HAD-IIA family hydrolase [Devosia subaequoris]MBB4051695.1 4-nitrophenyl phosphatase [Devosia subaequoris]MCP1209282.1 HAD-IIA family hydrolase [Devosia subaequoris]
MTSKPRRLSSIDELQFSAVLSDLDGVVYRGEEPVPGAIARFNRWRETGLPYCFVTNNAEKAPAAFADKIRRLGIDCVPDQVVTSGEIALEYVRRTFPKGVGLYVIGTQAFKDSVVEAGYDIVEKGAAAVLVALDRNFNYAMMATALTNILGGAQLIGTNPDLVRPLSNGFEPGAGAITQSIAAASGATPIFMGKPEAAIIETALSRLGFAPSQAIMIGDQLETDILAGQRAGVTSVFVETGVPLDARAVVTPDYILASL